MVVTIVAVFLLAWLLQWASVFGDP